jgi:hypothetical protein
VLHSELGGMAYGGCPVFVSSAFWRDRAGTLLSVSRTRFAQIELMLELPRGFIGQPLLRVSGEGTQASVIPEKLLT